MNPYDSQGGYNSQGGGYPNNTPYIPPSPGAEPPPLQQPYPPPYRPAPPPPPYGQYQQPYQQQYQQPPYQQPYYGYQPQAPRKDPEKMKLRRNGTIVGTGMVLVFVVMLMASWIPYMIFGALLSPNTLADWGPLLDGIVSMVAYGLGFVVPLLIMKAWLDIPASVAFPMKRPKASILIPGIFACLGLTIIGSVCYGIIATLLEGVGIVSRSPDFTPPTGVVAVIIYYISTAIMPAILEEMVFRGVVMQSLRRFGDGFALVVSAILFSMGHGNLVQGVPTLLLGLAIGYFVLRTGSIATGMVIHLVNNGLAITIDLLSRNATDEQLIVVNSMVMLFYLASGIIGLLFLLIKHQNMFRVAPSTSRLSTGSKFVAFFTAPMSIVYIIAAVLMTMLYLDIG